MDTRKPQSVAREYSKYRKKNNDSSNKEYNFYERVIKEDSVVEIRNHFAIVKNLFSYQIWDGFEVESHLLVIPKRFTKTISDFSNEERDEYFKILSDYESRGFSIYSRADQNPRKTVKHQHTHLIMLNHDKRIYLLFNIASKFLWWR